jgi:hypothetical protein
VKEPRERLLRRALRGRRAEARDRSGGGHLTAVVMRALGGDDLPTLMRIVSAAISDPAPPGRPLALSEQHCRLLLGLAQLHVALASPPSDVERALAFLGAFLRCDPRMAARAVPSLAEAARDVSSTLEALDFLALPVVVSNPQRVHLTWTCLAPLVQEGAPMTIWCCVLCLLLQTCSDKLLFWRAWAIIGKSCISQDPLVRVSTAAVLAELARLDLLRDVEHIVRWIQNRLTDEEPAAALFALAMLRHLVVRDELEFDPVFHVQEKRLGVDLSDAETVWELGLFAQEGIVALLGEGGLEEDEEDSRDGAGAIARAVSPQSLKAVALLIELALSPQLASEEALRRGEEAKRRAAARLRNGICGGLAGCSPQVLGWDKETLRSWSGVDSVRAAGAETWRFPQLKETALRGLDTAMPPRASAGGEEDDASDAGADLTGHVATLLTMLLCFEVEVHGSSLFRGGSGGGPVPSKGKVDGRTWVSESVLSGLPVASSVRDTFESDSR